MEEIYAALGSLACAWTCCGCHRGSDSKVHALVTSTRVTSINNTVPQLDIEQIELHWIITVDIFVGKEEFLSESEQS